MKKLLLSLLALAAASAWAATPIYLDKNAPIEQRVNDALQRMTLEEKVKILHAQSKFSSAGVPRLGIPELWTDDGPHGVRPNTMWDEWDQAGQTNDSCVAFPALTCLAASWNPELARLYGESLGEEALYRGKQVLLGPGVNIYRTPLNGRNFEYMGEDPFLASRIVVPYIQGLQSKGVAACVKHYALNNDETYRNEVNVQVSDRALREIYLPAFHAAVTEGKVWTLMGSYNLYQNQHCCHNKTLLNDILKKEWKFDGVVISDWGGCHNTDEAFYNGLDLEMGTGTDGLKKTAKNHYDYYFMANPLLEGIKSGKYSEEILNDKVRRVLRLMMRTSMAPERGFGALCSEAHYEAAERIAEEGIVLLKNDNNVLPLNTSQVKRVLIVGENALKMMTVGGGSSSLKVQREIIPFDGLKKRLGNGVEVMYERGYVGDASGEYNGVTTGQDLNESRTPDQLIADAVAKAKNADYVIFIGGLNKSYWQDCEGGDRKAMELPYDQERVIRALAKANKNFVFVNISGNAVAMPYINEVPAMIQGWYLGSQAGDALAAIICGDANPSGKLPFTWQERLTDVGAHALDAFPGTWRTGEKIIDEEYKEGIYVGYRWADKHGVKPTFAFGHGLSYTSFKITDARIVGTDVMTDSGTMTFAVTVKNTGKISGAEVVQLYINDKVASVDRPEKELKGFAKVALNPGESRTVTISIDKSALSFWNESTNAWTAEPGQFTALIGTSAANIDKKLNFTLK